ncbi:MAG: tyrosine-type recombinase/integrase [Hyphomicrobiales bacterium]
MGRPPLPVGTYGKVHLLQMPNGQYRARAAFRDHDGQTRKVSRFGPTKAAAERRLKEALRDRVGPSGGDVTPESRVREVAALWRAELEHGGLSDGSKEAYLRTLRNRVLPALGELRLREVTVPRVDRMVKAVHEHHGPSAARSARNVASLVLGLAVRHGGLERNPVREVQKVSGNAGRARALTPDEAVELAKKVAAQDSELGDLVAFMLGSGLRVGEALAVRREVVDLEAGTLEVNATVTRLSGRGTVLQRRTKSDAGWRVIALPDDAVELLRRRLAMSWPGNAEGLVFPNSTGSARNPSNVQRGLRAVLDSDEVGFPWVTTHTFRKTVATRLDEAGLSARAIADHLGHARPSMTQDVYMGRGVASAEAARVLGKRGS